MNRMGVNNSRGISKKRYSTDMSWHSILQYGDRDDVIWAQKFYGKELLKKVFEKNAQKINEKSCNFWSLYFKLDSSLCIAKRLTQKRSAFWTK